MFDERHFPYQYECVGCDETATVTHEDVQGVPSYFRIRTETDAADYVMKRRGWSVESMEGARCPSCVDTAV